MKDILLILKLKNNLILKRAKELWGEHVTQKEIGERVGACGVGDILNFKLSPITNILRTAGEPISGLSIYYWTPLAVKISKALKVLPEQLFPEHLREVRKSVFKIEVESSKFLQCYFPNFLPDPETLLQEKESKEEVKTLLKELSPAQQTVLLKRFGFEDEPQTLQSIANDMGLSQERIRQIEAKALSHLRKSKPS